LRWRRRFVGDFSDLDAAPDRWRHENLNSVANGINSILPIGFDPKKRGM
jgi:hypothetical protein